MNIFFYILCFQSPAQIIGVFMDLSKAFDQMLHHLIFRKVPECEVYDGIIALFQHYLKDRR